ncbi:MAG TPA: hypothetical protein VNZ50_11750 [Hyphomicrobiaceae bacterium]|jgi:hypothetical protein|nr:hypothetical protein [Hyphomicrobiaceae bacterium]
MAVRSSAHSRGWFAAILTAPFLLLTVASVTSTSASAQVVGTDPRNRLCQTLLTCNYSRGGAYRGCLSSYTCRVCRPQPVRCTASDIASGRTRCTELVCTWGG